MRRVLKGAVAAAALGAMAASAQAQQQPPQNEPITVTGVKPVTKKVDPNQVVCEKQQDIGSRLVSHRVCMTRSQWMEQRRLNRQDLDKAQTQRPM